MAFKNITTATTVTTTYRINSLLLTINNGWTGTIVVSTVITDPVAGPTATVVATITNPVTGNSFRYWDLTGGMTIVTTGTVGNMTSNWSGNRQPQ